MQIYGPTQLHGAQSIAAPHSSRIASPAGQSPAGPVQDEVHISDAARMAELVQQAGQLPDIRQDRVAALKAQIASGTYETEAKLSGAVDGLLDEIG